jgi:hypothetical protein
LCYQDNSFGLTQFGSKSCDYFTTNLVGINEKKNTSASHIRLYPNPVKDLLLLEGEDTQDLVISFVDVLGREVKRMKVNASNTLNVADMKAGVYQISVYKNTKFVYKTKMIKE